jgi:large subunit ribosomal protein L24
MANTSANTKFHIKKGDTVKVIAGDSKGKTGVVLSIETSKNRAIVEGLNLVSRHTKPSATTPNGGIIKKEAPIHVSNLALVGANGETTKVGRKLGENGKLQRYSKKTQATI